MTIPDNYGDLYNFPKEVLDVIRGLFLKELPFRLSASGQLQLFAYDNGAYILRSDLPFNEEVVLELKDKECKISELKSGREFKPDSNGRLPLMLMPYNNILLSIR